MKPEVVLKAKSMLAETPIWNTFTGTLYWTALFEGELHEFNPKTGQDDVYPLNELVGTAVPYQDGKVLIPAGDGIFVFDTKNNTKDLVVKVDTHGGENRIDEMRCDERGRIFFSTISKKYTLPDYTPDMIGEFYMVDTDKAVTELARMNHYNGMVWNGDNTKMYIIDSYNGLLLEYDYDLEKGPVSDLNVTMRFPEELASPDGICIDSEDNVYVCFWSGWIVKYNPIAKRELARFRMPCTNICCAGFGGADKKDLYISTSSLHFLPQDFLKQPDAGSIFKIRVDVEGTFDHYYKG